VTAAAPLWRLRLRTPRLELRWATDADVDELFALVRRGVHPPEEMPFAVAWTDTLEEPGRIDCFRDHYRGARDVRPDSWSVLLCVRRDGAAVGVQELAAEGFPATRTVTTGSWLGREHQAQGLGTEMRAAVLELAFSHLGAEAALSGVLDGNVASRRVAEKLGYRPSGRKELAPRGEPVGETVLTLVRADWRPRGEVRVDGLTPALLGLLGVDLSRR
jgi:RimJ/RimL family protein N-acetyltransferase